VFVPAFCPYPSCAHHLCAPERFFLGHGSYRPRCRPQPVPRFRCRRCRRTFSRQSFRADRYHKKPHINAAFLRLMVSCVGLRQAARALQVCRRTVERRFAWLARHASDYQRQRLALASLRGPFQLDELESFESNRYQPLTVPVLIHRPTLFVVATAVGSLRRKGRMTREQRRRRALHEARHGRRPTSSHRVVRRVLERLRDLTHGQTHVVLETDEKPLYGRLGRRILGGRLVWSPHPASARRDRANPLFPINHTNARLRHFMARLRRRTWCVSKRAGWLQGHLAMVALWMNYCRGITNRTAVTPAMGVGVAERMYRVEEVLGWRQDWRRVDLCPAF
jgi:transposase-like protein